MVNEVYRWVPYSYASLICLEAPTKRMQLIQFYTCGGTNQQLPKGKYIQMCLPDIHLSINV